MSSQFAITDAPSGSLSGLGYQITNRRQDTGSNSLMETECCPDVIDPMTLIALLGFLAAATFLLNELITMSMLMAPDRRKRSSFSEIYSEGNIFKRKHHASSFLNFCCCCCYS